MHLTDIRMKPIGIAQSVVTDPQDDFWGGVTTVIELDSDQFTPEALAGIEAFSHVEIVFHMHRVPAEHVERGARRPRGRSDWPKVGIFAQRAKRRPNRIGVSRARLLNVDDLRLTVEALDVIDQTPILDVKPYIREFGPRGRVSQPAWATELMANYYSNRRSRKGQ